MKASPQHPARRIEYASVLQVVEVARLERRVSQVVDIGGAGSPLPYMLEDVLPAFADVLTIDPAVNHDLHTYLSLKPDLADVVLCVSVIEHVKDEAQFLHDLAALVRPNGWLVLTMDFAEKQPDTYHFHWMRERIYSAENIVPLGAKLFTHGLTYWRPDPVMVLRACGNLLLPEYDYTFAQLVFQKTR